MESGEQGDANDGSLISPALPTVASVPVAPAPAGESTSSLPTGLFSSAERFRRDLNASGAELLHLFVSLGSPYEDTTDIPSISQMALSAVQAQSLHEKAPRDKVDATKSLDNLGMRVQFAIFPGAAEPGPADQGSGPRRADALK